MAHEPSFNPGARFGPYAIVRLLGAGAYGAVYEARQVSLGHKRVALKVLHAHLGANSMARQRFLREAEAIAQLRHPHIVEVYDLGEVGDVPFMAMEFLEGESLAQRLERTSVLPVREVVDLVLPVIAAVAAVHEQGVVHRDIKPENIFLAHKMGEDHPMLLDFGIAKVQSDGGSLTRTSTLLGTPFYMSPEQAHESKHIDARSDQWALGVILYECATGQRPFTGRALWEICANIIQAPVAPPRSVRPDIPELFDAAVMRAMAKVADERYADVRELGRALLSLASTRTRLNLQREFRSPTEEQTRPDFRLHPQGPSFAEASALVTVPVPVAPILGTLSLASQETVPSPSAPVRRRTRPEVVVGLIALVLVALAVSGVALRPRAQSSTSVRLAAEAPPGVTVSSAPGAQHLAPKPPRGVSADAHASSAGPPLNPATARVMPSVTSRPTRVRSSTRRERPAVAPELSPRLAPSTPSVTPPPVVPAVQTTTNRRQVGSI